MQAHLRLATIAALLLVTLSSSAASPTSQQCTSVDEPIDLRLWAAESYPSVRGFPPGQWSVETNGSSTFQGWNGQPTLFASNFETGRLIIIGQMRVEPDWDDDFIGFMLGYLPGDNQNPTADYLLVDWKRGTQYADFNWPSETPGSWAMAGLAVSRVQGVPTADEFWGHVDFAHPSSPQGQGVKELARASSLGSTGWEYLRDYQFQFEFGESGLRIFVDNKLQVELSGDFSGMASRRFAFYNFSQANVRYSGFKRRIICPPAAYDQTVSTSEDTPVSIALAATDPDGDPLTYSIVTPPAFGTLSGSGANVVYTPNPDFNGTDSFTFRVSDGITTSNVATVFISVAPVQDPPVIAPINDQTNLEGDIVSLQAMATDVDGDVLTFSSSGLPPGLTIDAQSGRIEGSLPYTAAGVYQVTVWVSDGSRSAATSFTWTVLNVNDPPSCGAAIPSVAEIWPPTPYLLATIQITGVTDPDGDPISLTPVSVFQDEEVMSSGADNRSPDALLSPSLQVRAERNGSGNGRVYHITFTASDDVAGSCVGTVSVCVPRSQGTICSDEGPLFNSIP
jgi:hypothetical protein